MPSVPENHTGAAAIPYQIVERYLGKADERLKLDTLKDLSKLTGRDYALELRGDELRIYQVRVEEVR